MARDTTPIGTDVVIGENTPPVETTVEALIRAYNRQPLNTNLADGNTIKWDATAGAWVPSSGSSLTKIWVPAADFNVDFGSPNVASASGVPFWLLDPTTTEVITTTVQFPSDWANYKLTLWWANRGTGSGVVRLRASNTGSFGDGEDITAARVLGAHQNVTAAAQNIVTTTVAITSQAVTAGESHLVSVEREGGHADDTLANDIGVLGVLLEKV